LGLASKSRFDAVIKKKESLKEIVHQLNTTRISPEDINPGLESINSSPTRERTSAASLLRRPEISIKELRNIHHSTQAIIGQFSTEVAEQAEILLKYEPYIDREQKMAEKIESLDAYQIHDDFDYDRVKALSSEAREKLKKMRPATIGQMSRISGVSPADVSIMAIYLGK
jgi:tRNA uridine 5-carboxymethylaminomethyl modification enzyme